VWRELSNVWCRYGHPNCGKGRDSFEQLRANRHDKFDAETMRRLIGLSAEQLEE
jgi:hypothetical protein